MSIEILKNQIEENRKKISTDGFKMSLGELNSMYKDGEVVINPDYQRYFRWNNIQKSRLNCLKRSFLGFRRNVSR